MDHFPEQDWVEFARDMLPSQMKAAMQNHLDQGCTHCQNILGIWLQVVDRARQEKEFEPSERSLQLARAGFLSSNWRQLAAKSTIARLVFDSFSRPLPAFVRSVAPASRQLVHETEPYMIDLRLESDPTQERISLMGQVLNSKNPEQMIDDVEVLLIGNNKEEPLAATSINSMGEFQLELPSEEGLQLLVNIRGQKAIGIVLPGKKS
jgi:hypothetical protein